MNEESKQSKGGRMRATKLAPKRLSEIARTASLQRWAKQRVTQEAENALRDSGELPVAKWRGFLSIRELDIPVYVLETGDRVIGRTSATEMLTGIKGGGGLEKYLGVRSLNRFINMDLVLERLIPFRLPEVEGLGKDVKGLRSDAFIDICRGFVSALEASRRPDSGVKLTDRQVQMALKASIFLAAVAKTGLDALIDEVTGYQYERPDDALQAKLRAYLSEDMRQWEKTFPDQIWVEFGRLTNWKGSVIKRPKYWGKLVTELIYEYLDPDVAQWLKENAPKPKHGQNYHQWLSDQYGLQKLIELMWKFIGVAGTCQNLSDCRQKWAEINGRALIQYWLPFPPLLPGETVNKTKPNEAH